MNRVLLLSLFLLLVVTPPLFAEQPGTVEEYRKIIATRCTSCHEAGRIEKAMADKRNVTEILNKMVRMGAELTTRDKDVLGVFWGSPLKEEKL